MSTEEHRNSLVKLIEATRLVASEYDVQLAVMPVYVHVPDEIALVFEDAYNSVDKLIKNGLVNRDQCEALTILNNNLNAINLWTVDALRDADEWNAVRRLAQAVLTAFDKNDGKNPDLFWLQFVPAKM